MLTGFKYATITDGTTTVTLSNLLPSSKYNKTQKVKKDVDNKLNVIEEKATLLLISPDIEDSNQLRNWMINKTAITVITIYGTDFTINWTESCKILFSHKIPTSVGNRATVAISVRLVKETLNNISVT